MFDLKNCKCGGSPVIQSRGNMKPEDHHMQFIRLNLAKELRDKAGVWLPVEEFRRDVFETEDQGSDNASDMRISCPQCGAATGWMRRDIEDYRRHADGDYRRYVVKRDGNLDAIQAQWNNGVK